MKVEEVHMKVETFAECAKISQQDLLHLEMLVMSAVRFDLHVRLPYRPLEGFLLLLQDHSGVPATAETLDLLREQASIVIRDKLLHLDAPLTHLPNTIALAALAIGASDISLDVTA